MRKTRRELIASGLCRNYNRCGNSRSDKGTSEECRLCADARNARRARRLSRIRSQRRRKDLCLQCGAPRDNPTKLCDDCRHLQSLADRAHYMRTTQQSTFARGSRV